MHTRNWRELYPGNDPDSRAIREMFEEEEQRGSTFDITTDAEGNVEVRVGFAPVGNLPNDNNDRGSEGVLQKNSTSESSDLYPVQPRKDWQLNMKQYDLKSYLKLASTYRGVGQGSHRTVIEQILLGEDVPVWIGSVWCREDLKSLQMLLKDLAGDALYPMSLSSPQISTSDPADSANLYEWSVSDTEGFYLISNRAYVWVDRRNLDAWVASFIFVGGDLTETEIKAFDNFRTREDAKKDKTVYQNIWLLVDYGSGDLDFHDNKVKLSEFKKENYTEENAAWIPRLKEALFNPRNTGRLTICQGPPGTGKTRYLRALMQELGSGVCPVVLPVALSHELSSPRMLGVITSNSDFAKKKILLIIEDGDQLLEKRERSASVISDFLNVIDGLIGEVIDLHVIVTTNLQKKDFDPAITRPGRLHSILYFDALDAAQAALVFKRETGEEFVKEKDQDKYTLAEIYAKVNDHHNGVRQKKFAPAGAYL